MEAGKKAPGEGRRRLRLRPADPRVLDSVPRVTNVEEFRAYLGELMPHIMSGRIPEGNVELLYKALSAMAATFGIELDKDEEDW